MMKATAQIIQIAPYGKMHVWCKKHQCRHPIDKPCDASIEAYRLEFEAEVRETKRKADRDYYKKKKDEEKQHASELTTVENIDESPDKVLGLNAIGKPYGASYDPNYRVKTLLTNIKRLYAPMKPAPPSSPCETLLEKGWLQATPKAKRQFLRKYWDEILREKSAADDDCTEHTPEDASLVAVELAV